MFIQALRISRQSETHPKDEAVSQGISPHFWFWALAIFTITAMFAESVLLPIEGLIGAIGWYGVSLLGLISMITITRSIFRQRKNLGNIALASTALVVLLLASLAIGNEIDATFGNDPKLWQQYTTFFRETSTHARSLRPGLLVGAKAMFPGAVGYAQEPFQKLNEYSDIVMVTYYPLDEDFQVQDPAQVQTDLRELTSTYKGRPIFLAEAGYPSSQVNGSSKAKQAEFMQYIFKTWDEYAEQIQLISFTWLTDLSLESVAEFEDYYGFENKAFAEFLRTLGMRTFEGSGSNKAAYLTLQAKAKIRGMNAVGISDNE